MYCVQLLLPVVLLPRQLMPPLATFVFVIALYATHRPCPYCAVLFAGLLYSTCFWSDACYMHFASDATTATTTAAVTRFATQYRNGTAGNATSPSSGNATTSAVNDTASSSLLPPPPASFDQVPDAPSASLLPSSSAVVVTPAPPPAAAASTPSKDQQPTYTKTRAKRPHLMQLIHNDVQRWLSTWWPEEMESALGVQPQFPILKWTVARVRAVIGATTTAADTTAATSGAQDDS
ncbi:hypothetical protein RI367_002692 [Sorochytrium milnesiophthora]